MSGDVIRHVSGEVGGGVGCGDEGARRSPHPETGGEPACMLPLLCPSCGRVPDGPRAATCGSCGADMAEDHSPGSS